MLPVPVSGLVCDASWGGGGGGGGGCACSAAAPRSTNNEAARLIWYMTTKDRA